MAEDQTSEMSARLKAFAIMLRFGHDLFNARDFAETAQQVVNNSHVLLNFKSASLVEIGYDGKAHVCAQYAQPIVNRHSRLAVLQSDLCKVVELGPEPLTLDEESIKDEKYPSAILEELLADGSVYCLIAIPKPEAVSKQKLRFVWMLEYEKAVPNYALTSARLLASSAGEALYFHRLCTASGWNVKRMFSWKKVFLYLLLVALLVSMFIRVPESAKAEFTLMAPDISSTYAWFDGPIANCFFQDSSFVKQGDIIAEYDTSQLLYRLASARSQVSEMQAEYDVEELKSFTDAESRARLNWLKTKLESAKVSVEEAEWYLSKSTFIAPTDGILALADGRAELLIGRAVHAGEKIFDIYAGSGMVAEIPVDQKDASVLQNPEKLEITLFLYNMPERPIKVELLEISSYPELTEQRTYCYTVRAKLISPEDQMHLLHGMRGTAKITGEKVPFWYHMFKNLLLYFRGI